MHALVTGAAGFIGSHLCDRLLSLGATVIGLDRSTRPYHLTDAGRRDRFRLVEGSISRERLMLLLDGVTQVFHLAGRPGVAESWDQCADYLADNVEATRLLLDACVGRPIERIVYASSSAVYGYREEAGPMREDRLPRPLSPYGVTKLAAEHLCHVYHQAHGLPVVTVRYFTVYGPRQRPDMAFHRWCRALQNGQPITIYGGGQQTRDYTYVADIVEGTIAAGIQGVPNHTYNLGGGGSPVGLREILPILRRLNGGTVDTVNTEALRGDMPVTWADATAARQGLEWSPHTTLDDGLAAEWDWLKAEGVS